MLSMPDDDGGDRIHNFFPQDNLSQGQHHQQIVDRNWSVVNNNLWIGNPGNIGVQSANTKNYNLQHPDVERSHNSLSLQDSHGLNFTQSVQTPDFAKNIPHSQQLNLHGSMYGNRVQQTRQDEANFLAVDTVSNQHNLVSRGLSIYESHQGSGPQHQTKSLIRSETSESPVSFDLFGNQQQMNHSQSSMLQTLQRQQSGFSDVQQLQQQLMLIKMQELQRQQQLRQLDARQQNAVNPTLPFAKQLTGSYPSSFINGNANSDSLNNPWGTEHGNMNWLQCNSPVVQGSSNGVVFSSNHGQAHHLVDSVSQHGVQSLYGVPVSGSRGNVTQFSQMAADKPSVQQMATFGSSLPGNQYTAFSEQGNAQDEPLISGQRFPGENHFGYSSGQSVTPVMDTGNIQQVNHMQRNASLQETLGTQDLAAREKALSQGAVSQNEVSLDPTEERILFGSDDNIWAAFGKSSNMSGDAGAPFDNFQSGTWSALMQSALAETSNSDIGQQEEWSGLNIQNNVVPHETRPSSYIEKQQMSFHNDPPSSNSSEFPDNSTMNHNLQNIQGVLPLGNKFACEPDQRLQGKSSQRLGYLSKEGNKWSNSGLVQNAVNEVSSIHGNILHSLDAETNMKSISGHSSPAQSGLQQQYSTPNGWNALGSVAPSGNGTGSMHQNQKSAQHPQGYEQKRVLHGESGHGGSIWNSRSLPSSSVEVEHAKSLAGSLQVNREGITVSNALATPSSTTARFDEEPSQYHSNSQMSWQNFNPIVKCQGSDSVETSLHHVNNNNQAINSLLNSHDKAEKENYKRKGNSSDCNPSNLSRHNAAGRSKENMLSDVSDSQCLPSGKQKSFNQIGQKNSSLRKFQFHPMGNLDEDVEPQYGMKQSSHSLAMSQRSTSPGHLNFFSQIHKSPVGLEMEQSADQKDAEDIIETPTHGSFPARIQNALPFNRHVNMHTPSKDTRSSSQNMLELLHKVDQSGDHGSVMHFSSSGHNLSSEKPEAENSDSSVGLRQQSQSSTSQGFGLQLGPPSHRTAVTNPSFVSQSSLQTAIASHQSQALPDSGDKGQSQLLSSTSAVQSLPPSNERIVGEFNQNKSVLLGHAANNAFLHNMPENFSLAFSSGFPSSRSPLQYHQMVRESGQVSIRQQDASRFMMKDDLLGKPSTQTAQTSLPSDAGGNVQHDNSDSFGVTSQQTGKNDLNARRGSARQTSAREAVSLPLSAPGEQVTSTKMLPNMLIDLPRQPHLPGDQIHKVSSHVSQLPQSSVLGSDSYPSQKQSDQDAITERSLRSESGRSSMSKESPAQQVFTGNTNAVWKMGEPQGAEPVCMNLSDGSPKNSTSIQKDLEAFGRSLKSNNFSHQNYSLLNQMRAMRGAELDPNNRALKKMKGPEGGEESQPITTPNTALSSENSTIVGDALTHHSAVPSGDPKTLSFSGTSENAQKKASSQHGNLALQNMFAFAGEDPRTNPHGNASSSVRVEQSQVRPQMVPSWFSQYGTFSNGQMVAMYDARRTTISKTAEQPFNLGNSSSGIHTLNSMEQVTATAVDTRELGNLPPSTSSTKVSFAPQSLPLNVSGPKKRKRATFRLTPWHKEVSEGLQNLPTISMAELKWAKAANRLTEKVEDEVELIEDGQPMLRARRRLTVTTQLMQQLFCPPKLAILSSDAESNYECVAYSISRLALGDACGLVSHPSGDFEMPQSGVSLFPDKCKVSEKANDQHVFSVMEDIMGRARKLENEFLRLDRRASAVDLRVECQELEKFSIINRFAKFHGRGQPETGETSSVSDGRAANALRPYPQRYVTALPAPRSLPDRVQCLSL